MKLRWTRRALSQLADAQDFIAQDNPLAAKQIAERIARSTEMLLSQPGMGRIGRVAGTREWIISGTPYFLVYVVHDEILQVLRLIHGKQDWPVIAHSKKS